MKRIFLFIVLLMVAGLLTGCGSGSGSSSEPKGVNPGLASIVQLIPTSYVAHSNGCVTIKGRVLDGNGNPIAFTPMTFTIEVQSALGSLSGTCGGAGGASITVTTDNQGYATVYINSPISGFSTLLAQVSGGSVLSDRKTIYFTDQVPIVVAMTLDVDSSPGNGIYNEANDSILFQTTTDNTVEILATVFNAGGALVAGESVFWSADSTEATFVRTDVMTNNDGQAKAIVKVVPGSIRQTETFLNIMAFAGNGAANMVSLLLEDVVVNNVILKATPTAVAPNGTSTVTAAIYMNTGVGVTAPNGLTVSFLADCGSVTPFAQTTGGVASATFTAPSTIPLDNDCTVTAAVPTFATAPTVDITVRAALRVSPATASICENDGTCTAGVETASFGITGGVPPYSVTSAVPAIIPNPGVAGGSFTVDANDSSIGADTSVTLTVTDDADGVATVTVSVVNQP